MIQIVVQRSPLFFFSFLTIVLLQHLLFATGQISGSSSNTATTAQQQRTTTTADSQPQVDQTSTSIKPLQAAVVTSGLTVRVLASTVGQQPFCPCDLNPSACDLNCCCDRLCDESNRVQFSRCDDDLSITTDEDDFADKDDEMTGLAADRYCVWSGLVYKSNAGNRMSWDRNLDLLCIYQDNTRQRQLLVNEPVVRSESGFERLKRLAHFEWTLDAWKQAQTLVRPVASIADEYYRDGGRIWFIPANNGQNNLIPQPLQLPASLLQAGSECNGVVAIKFLRSFDATCIRVADVPADDRDAVGCSDRWLSVKNYISILLLRNSIGSFLNLTESGGYSSSLLKTTDECIARNVCIRPSLVLVQTSAFGTKSLEEPKLEDGKCLHVLQRFHLRVFQNSSFGIGRASIEFQYANISIGSNGRLQPFEQSFRVSFELTDQPQQQQSSSTATTVKRSGNPGYLSGRPVLASFTQAATNTTSSQTTI